MPAKKEVRKIVTYRQVQALINSLLETGKRDPNQPFMVDGERFYQIIDQTTGEILVKGERDVSTLPLIL